MSERCDTCAHRRGYHYQGVTECAFVNDEQDSCRCQRFIPMTAVPPRPAASDLQGMDLVGPDCTCAEVPHTHRHIRPGAPDATAGDGLRSAIAEAICDSEQLPECDYWDQADAVLALPALRDVLAAAARDAEKVRRVEELAKEWIRDGTAPVEGLRIRWALAGPT